MEGMKKDTKIIGNFGFEDGNDAASMSLDVKATSLFSRKGFRILSGHKQSLSLAFKSPR